MKPLLLAIAARIGIRRLTRGLYGAFYPGHLGVAQSMVDLRNEMGPKIYAKLNGTVVNGLFRGMKIPENTAWGHDLVAMLLGSYEEEVQQLLRSQDPSMYEAVVDIGCANGFYAVGLAIIWSEVKVFAFDFNPDAQKCTNFAASENGVDDRVSVGGYLGPSALVELVSRIEGRTLVIVDIEGDELSLFQNLDLLALSRVDFLIECHDRRTEHITPSLEKILKDTHRLSVVDRLGRHPASFPQLKKHSDVTFAGLLNELRFDSSHWLWAEFKESN